MSFFDRVRDWWTGDDDRKAINRVLISRPRPETQEYIGLQGTRDARLSRADQEAAYVKELERQLGILGVPDIRRSQYAALYDTANNILGAAGADLRSRGIAGDMAVAQKAAIAQRELIPAAAQIEQQYANMLMAEQNRRLGMARQRGEQMTALDQQNLDRQAARRLAEWQLKNQIAGANVDRRNQWTQDQWAAMLAAAQGQYGVGEALAGSLIGAAGQIGAAYAGRPVTKTYGMKS